MDDLRADARAHVDRFLADGDIAALLRWVTANRRAVYAGHDDETRELVDKARTTIDGVLKGLVPPEKAPDHLRGLIAGGGGLDRKSGRPSQHLA
jgi:hypothetical protein